MLHVCPGTLIFGAKDLHEIETGYRLQGHQMQVGYIKISRVRQTTCYNSKTVQDVKLWFGKMW